MSKLLFFVLLYVCISLTGSAQPSYIAYASGEHPSVQRDCEVIIDTINCQHISNYPPASRDFQRLGLNTCIYFGSSLVVFGVLTVMPEKYSRWEKREITISTMTGKWSDNVKTGPVNDNDNFFFNNVAHPYCGAVYYITARSSGFKCYESFLYGTVMSTLFWEYGVEAFAEVPSRQDLIMTPIIGSAIGEVFYHVKKVIMKNDKRILGSRFLGTATLLFLDPFNTVLDGVGYKQKVKSKPVSPPVEALRAVY